MSKISQYPGNTSPSASFEFLGTDPGNSEEGPTGTTETVTLATLTAAIGGGGSGGVTGWKNFIADYGADPTGVTSCSTALATACTAAVAAQPKSFGLMVPPGQYLVTTTQDLPYNMILQGSGVNGGTVSGERTGSWFNVSSGFSGSGYVLGFKDNPPPTTFTGVNGCLVSGIGIYGGSQTGSAVNGLYIVGPTLTTLSYVSISQMTGWAVASGTDPSAGEQFDFGQSWFRVQADSCGTVSGGGFQLSGCEDSTFINCYSIGNNNGPGFYITACDNTKFIGCNSEWNSNYGFYVTGDWAYFTGGCTFTGCSTDANTVAGFMCDATWSTGLGAGTGPGIIHVTGCHFRRDGQGNGTTTAGIWIGATTLPMIFSGFSTMPSIGDSGGTTYTPKYGVYLANASYAQPIVFNAGLAWGLTNGAYTHTAAGWPTNSTVFNQTGVLLAHGANSAPTYGS